MNLNFTKETAVTGVTIELTAEEARDLAGFLRAGGDLRVFEARGQSNTMVVYELGACLLAGLS